MTADCKSYGAIKPNWPNPNPHNFREKSSPSSNYPSSEIEIWERHGEITHLITGPLEYHSHPLGQPTMRSRGFSSEN